MSALPPPLSASPLDMGQIPMGEMPMPPSGGSRLGALKPIGPSAGAGGGRPPPAMPPRPISRMPAEVPVVENRGEEFANKILDRKDESSRRIREQRVVDERRQGYDVAKEERTAVREREKAAAITEAKRTQAILDASLQQDTEKLRADLPGGSKDRLKLNQAQLNLSTAQVGLNANIASATLRASLIGDKVNLEKLMEATKQKDQLVRSINDWETFNNQSKASDLWARSFPGGFADPSDELEAFLRAYADSQNLPLSDWTSLRQEGTTTQQLSEYHWNNPSPQGAMIKPSIELGAKNTETAIAKAKLAAAAMETLDPEKGEIYKQQIDSIIVNLGPIRALGSESQIGVQNAVFGRAMPIDTPDPKPEGNEPTTPVPTDAGENITTPGAKTDAGADVPLTPQQKLDANAAAEGALENPPNWPSLGSAEAYDDTLILKHLAKVGANLIEKITGTQGEGKYLANLDYQDFLDLDLPILEWDKYPDAVKALIIGTASGLPSAYPNLIGDMWNKAAAAGKKLRDMPKWFNSPGNHPANLQQALGKVPAEWKSATSSERQGVTKKLPAGAELATRMAAEKTALVKISTTAHDLGVKEYPKTSPQNNSAIRKYYDVELGKLAKTNWQLIPEKVRTKINKWRDPYGLKGLNKDPKAGMSKERMARLTPEEKAKYEASEKEMSKRDKINAKSPKTRAAMRGITGITGGLILYDLSQMWDAIPELTAKQRKDITKFAKVQEAQKAAALEWIRSDVIQLVDLFRTDGDTDAQILADLKKGAAEGYEMENGSKLSQAHVEAAEEYINEQPAATAPGGNIAPTTPTPTPPTTPTPLSPTTPTGANDTNATTPAASRIRPIPGTSTSTPGAIKPADPNLSGFFDANSTNEQADPFAPPPPVSTVGPPPLPGGRDLEHAGVETTSGSSDPLVEAYKSLTRRLGNNAPERGPAHAPDKIQTSGGDARPGTQEHARGVADLIRRRDEAYQRLVEEYGEEEVEAQEYWHDGRTPGDVFPKTVPR